MEVYDGSKPISEGELGNKFNGQEVTQEVNQITAASADVKMA